MRGNVTRNKMVYLLTKTKF